MFRSSQIRSIILRSKNLQFKTDLHTTPTTLNLFSKAKSLQGSLPQDPETLLRPRSAKQTAPTNPADILTQNDILMYSQKPSNYIESIKSNGFHLSNQLFVASPDQKGNIVGLLLIGSETFEIKLTNKEESKNWFEVNSHIVTFNQQLLNIFNKIHPKPEILVMGLGKESRLLSVENKRFFNELGINLEVSDSFNGGQIFDLLSTERPGVIGALLLPPNI
ncbi:hypothetical protein KGF54_001386 [Candida jiufengensis]|uniref:uncharacterized protein n=1 Tax=Candida jiufengensis TaxID=497108 RepID=UPI0022251710|nr:uncharacterized protein KGF54_001386 [Candida jiufengensis]KAI5955884.1 hypothetical protein KGF54_001386 [Candida jiufengensis]